jgi:hypothetical protein
MAVRFTPDDQASALAAWSVNFPEWKFRHEQERQMWMVLGLPDTPWGEFRDTAIGALADGVGITLSAGSPWEREQELWAAWADQPPIPYV